MKTFTLTAFAMILSLSGQDLVENSGELEIGLPNLSTFPTEVTINQRFGTLNYNADLQSIRYTGDFQLKTNTGIELKSQNAYYNLKEGRVELSGDVSVFNGSTFQRGDKASYNFKNKSFSTSGLKVSVDPILLDSGSFSIEKDKNGKDVYVGTNAAITTHDVEHPSFWVKAKKIKVYPDDRVTFNNLRLYAGNTPVFWLPYFSQPLDKELGYHFSPGFQSHWGGYLLNRYGVLIDGEEDSILMDQGRPWLLTQYHIDVRTRRGVGVGVDFKDIRQVDNPNLTGLSLYYLNDLDPSLSRSGIPRGFVNEDRYRVDFKHRYTLRENARSSTYIDSDLSLLSDEHFLEDYESSRFSTNSAPDNNLSLLHHDQNFLAGITTKFQLNTFHNDNTRLPEIYFDFVKSPVLNTNLLYESSTSIGSYQESLATDTERSLREERSSLAAGDPRIAEIDSLLEQGGFFRFHTWHELTYPIHLSDGIGLAPYAGIGHTNYWDINNGTDNFNRTHLEAGVDFSLKYSKHYQSVQSKRWGLNELLHVAQPYASFTVLRTDEIDPSFQPIDALSPTTEVRPIRAGRFSAIDELNDWTILRLGMRNHLITKRDGDNHNWLTLDNYIDVFFNDPEFDRDFSNLYNNLTWNPAPWLKAQVSAQLPIGGDRAGFSEFTSKITYLPSKSSELTFGYRLLNSHPTLEDSSQFHIRYYNRFNEKWGASAFQRWELDDGTLESQQYALYYDLGAWNSSIGFTRRDNRIQDEFGVFLSFTLKEFPSISIPLSIDNE